MPLVVIAGLGLATTAICYWIVQSGSAGKSDPTGLAKEKGANSDATESARGELLNMCQNLVDASGTPEMGVVQKGVEAISKTYGKVTTLELIEDIARTHPEVDVRMAAIYSLRPYLPEIEIQKISQRSLGGAARARLGGTQAEPPNMPAAPELASPPTPPPPSQCTRPLWRVALQHGGRESVTTVREFRRRPANNSQ